MSHVGGGANLATERGDGVFGFLIGLCLDSIQFFLQVGLGKSRPTHSLGLDPQRQVELRRMNCFEKSREVIAGKAIELTAVANNGGTEFTLSIMTDRLEKQMLNDMAEPG